MFERVFGRIARAILAWVAAVVGFVVSVISSAFFLPRTISAEVGVILVIILGVLGGWIAAKLALRATRELMAEGSSAESGRR